MKPSSLALFLALGLVATQVASPSAQTRPDFSGRWVLDEPENSVTTGPRKPFGRECQISQTLSSLTITFGSQTSTYETDDKTRRTVSEVGKFKVNVSTKTTWRAGTLVIVRKVETQPETTLRLSIQDSKLVVESTASDFSVPGAGVKTQYRRVR